MICYDMNYSVGLVILIPFISVDFNAVTFIYIAQDKKC